MGIIKKILLVEDELTLIDLYEEVLKDGGFNVETASDGDSAIAKVNSADWDLLVLDIMLPKVDGLEILRRLKNNETTRSKPVIVFSNLDNKEIVQQVLDLGASSYLVKSNIDPSHLVEEVNKYIPHD